MAQVYYFCKNESMNSDESTEKKIFRRFPFSWPKIIIWGLFLTLLYILRDFFLILFLTFLIAYIARTFVSFAFDLIPEGFRKGWHDQLLVIVFFISLLFGLYGASTFFAPRLAMQGKALIKKVGTLDESPKTFLDNILRAGIGSYLVDSNYGEPGTPKFDSAFNEFKTSPTLPKSYAEFKKFSKEFERTFVQRYRQVVSTVMNNEVYDSSKDETSTILQKFQSINPTLFEKLGGDLFELNYQKEDNFNYNFNIFQELLKHSSNIEEFSNKYIELFPFQNTEKKLDSVLKTEFKYQKSIELLATWKKGALAEKINNEFEKYLVGIISNFGKFIGSKIQTLFTLPVQIILSLMLSFFISMDMPRMKKGVQRLKKSRLSGFYNEIAPGVVTFGKLIGRSFQAQGIIAFINTLLTFAAMKYFGVENALFLSSIVFLASFIPVLGVVLSSVPIAIMSIVQDGGGITLALWMVGAILLVHFIETSFLNPKIVGTFLHLHPVMVLAILAIGEHFFGAWGLLLGTPVAVYILRVVVLDEGLPWESKVS